MEKQEGNEERYQTPDLQSGDIPSPELHSCVANAMYVLATHATCALAMYGISVCTQIQQHATAVAHQQASCSSSRQQQASGSRAQAASFMQQLNSNKPQQHTAAVRAGSELVLKLHRGRGRQQNAVYDYKDGAAKHLRVGETKSDIERKGEAPTRRLSCGGVGIPALLSGEL